MSRFEQTKAATMRTCCGLDRQCGRPTTSTGRLVRSGRRGPGSTSPVRIVGRLCDECSAESLALEDEARAAADDYRDDWR